MSETATARPWLSRFCIGLGLDIGAGGDPIMPDSITVDKKAPAAWVLDAHRLPFTDNVFKYVYSSHCLEDFEDTECVLREWIRVIEPGGNLVLLLPDQKIYEAHCQENNVVPNADHKHPDFGPDYVLQFILFRDVIHFERRCTYNPYSWCVVVKKG